jgi:hypothetical protein
VRAKTRVFVAIASVVIVAGCTADPTASPGPSGAAEMTFHESVVQARTEAESGGADEAQLAILDAALTSDEIRLEDAQQALTAYGDCLEGAGLALAGVGVVDDAGFKRLDYSVQAGEADSGVMDACYAKTYQWVDMLYQTQPAATQASDAKFEAALPALIACLQAGGIPVDAASPADEVKQAMLAVLREDIPKAGDPGVTVNEDGSLSSDRQGPKMEIVSECLYASDISGF